MTVIEVDHLTKEYRAGTYSVRLASLDTNWRFLFKGESLKTFTVKAKRMERLNINGKQSISQPSFA